MAIAEVVQIPVSGADGTGTTTTSTGVDTTGAAAVVLFFGHEGSPTTYTFSHSKAGTDWTTTIELDHANGDFSFASAILVNPTVGAAHTFTVTPAASKTFRYVWGMAISGTFTLGSIIEQQQSATGSTAGGLDDVDAGTLTPAGAAYLIQGTGNYAGATGTAANGFTAKAAAGGRFSQARNEGAGGTFNPSHILSVAADYGTVAYALKESGGGGGGGSNSISVMFRNAIERAKRARREWARNAGGRILVPAYPTLKVHA